MSEPKVIEIAENAIAEVKRIITTDGREGIGLRLGVRGGGCSGLSYHIDLGEPAEADNVQHEDGFDVYVDQKSSLYLKDSILVYNDSLQDRGFKFQNPNASNTCGCGESFAV